LNFLANALALRQDAGAHGGSVCAGNAQGGARRVRDDQRHGRPLHAVDAQVGGTESILNLYEMMIMIYDFNRTLSRDDSEEPMDQDETK